MAKCDDIKISGAVFILFGGKRCNVYHALNSPDRSELYNQGNQGNQGNRCIAHILCGMKTGNLSRDIKGDGGIENESGN